MLTYSALRTTLARLTRGIARFAVKQGANGVTPTLGGAAVNRIVMEHHRQLAHRRSTIRQPERRYDAGEIETLYRPLAATERHESGLRRLHMTRAFRH